MEAETIQDHQELPAGHQLAEHLEMWSSASCFSLGIARLSMTVSRARAFPYRRAVLCCLQVWRSPGTQGTLNSSKAEKCLLAHGSFLGITLLCYCLVFTHLLFPLSDTLVLFPFCLLAVEKSLGIINISFCSDSSKCFALFSYFSYHHTYPEAWRNLPCFPILGVTAGRS